MNKDLLHTRVVREIISLIASGQYPEGKRLPAERKLCERFAVSRGTLRKALEDLEKMGAIKIKPQSGAYVQKFTQKRLPGKVLPKNFKDVTLRDIIVARRAIELAAIEITSEKINKKDFIALEKVIKYMQQSLENLPEFLKYDMVFHESIVEFCNNSVLIAAFEAITEYHRYSQVFSSTYDTCEGESLKYHKLILKALQNRSKKQAVRYLSLHFENMLNNMS